MSKYENKNTIPKHLTESDRTTTLVHEIQRRPVSSAALGRLATEHSSEGIDQWVLEARLRAEAQAEMGDDSRYAKELADYAEAAADKTAAHPVIPEE